MKQKNYNLSLKNILALMLVSVLIGGFVFLGGVNNLLRDGQQLASWQQNSLAAFMPGLKKLFANQTASADTVRVVDEESQTIEVVKNASPAVVSIVASAEVPKYETYYANPGSDLPGDMGQFFNFNVPMQRQNGTQKQEIGAGTGFLVSSDGYIITNKHVVENEQADYVVYLNDKDHLGEKLNAKVLARDPVNDLAVLKIEKTGLPFLTFGNSDNLQVGQNAITIGYALGQFDNTVSKGVISGLSRTITAAGVLDNSGSEQLKNLIQTDAAINPGNSGGPMLNINGQVIGVNVAMANAQNIGFALPGNLAQSVFDQVKNTGTIKTPSVAFLGLRYMIITDDLKSNNNLPFDYGALITRGDTKADLAVVPGSPADKAGIVENDIILEINGKQINTRNQLSDLVANYKPGDTITLKVYHKGQTKDVKVVLGEK